VSRLDVVDYRASPTSDFELLDIAIEMGVVIGN